MKFLHYFSFRFYCWLALAAVVVFSFVQSIGYWFFNREVGNTESIVPKIVFTEAGWMEKWDHVVDALGGNPPLGGYHLSCRDFERIKELIVIANQYAPEEHEGGDRVVANAPCIRYLANLYPEIASRVDARSDKVSIGNVYAIIRDRQPSCWRIVWLAIRGKSDNP